VYLVVPQARQGPRCQRSATDEKIFLAEGEPKQVALYPTTARLPTRCLTCANADAMGGGGVVVVGGG
jgi:hypothetical protein